MRGVLYVEKDLQIFISGDPGHQEAVDIPGFFADMVAIGKDLAFLLCSFLLREQDDVLLPVRGAVIIIDKHPDGIFHGALEAGEAIDAGAPVLDVIDDADVDIFIGALSVEI